jgi:hypothetical protein
MLFYFVNVTINPECLHTVRHAIRPVQQQHGNALVGNVSVRRRVVGVVDRRLRSLMQFAGFFYIKKRICLVTTPFCVREMHISSRRASPSARRLTTFGLIVRCRIIDDRFEILAVIVDLFEKCNCLS